VRDPQGSPFGDAKKALLDLIAAIEEG